MSERIYILQPAKQFTDPDASGLSWIQVFPYDEWDHPLYGKTVMTPDKAGKLVRHFYEGARGIEVTTDYEHGEDAAKGGKASGTIRKVEARNDGLWCGVEWTPTARKEIADGEWRYFSGAFFEEYTRQPDGEKFECVLDGGGLTNKPWVKGMMPVNLSELVVEKEATVADEPKSEVVEKEHSEPGSGAGGEPQPRETGEHGKGEQGTRGSDPSAPDEQPSVTEAKIREALGLDDDDDLATAIDELIAEVAPIREAVKSHSERKTFAEQFPAEAKRLARLEKYERDQQAKAFSERYVDVQVDDKSTGKGFSALALQKIEEFYKKFSEQSATLADVQDVLDTIGSTGLVDYADHGSRQFKEGVTVEDKDAPKLFAEKVAAKMEEDKMDYRTAVETAATENPELFNQYQAAYGGSR